MQLYQVVDDGTQGHPTSGGTPYGDTFTVSAADGWTKTIDNLPLTDELNGQTISYAYYAQEIGADPSWTVSSVWEEDKFVITNSASTSVTVLKKWVNGEGEELSAAPGSVSFDLMQVEKQGDDPTPGGNLSANIIMTVSN